MPDPMTSHVYAAQEEDVTYLMDHGASLEVACARVGVDPGTLRDRIQRRVQRGG